MARRPRLADRIRRYLFGYTMARRLQLLGALAGRRLAPPGPGLAARPHSQRPPPDSAFDQEYGVETSAPLPWWVLGDESRGDAYSANYAPSSPTALRTALQRLPDLRAFTFVDLGCGKGRALIVASEYPFKAIIGVEKSRNLASVAEANLRSVVAAHPERPAIRVIQGDAATFPVPAGDLVIYLFHPFWLPVMRAVADGLVSAMAVQRRRLFVIYLNPTVRAPLDVCPCLIAAPELGFVLPADDERRNPLTVAVWRERDGC